MDGLLHRLYTPILFRALQAANSAVRLNALQLLVDVFPLQVRPDWSPASPRALGFAAC